MLLLAFLTRLRGLPEQELLLSESPRRPWPQPGPPDARGTVSVLIALGEAPDWAWAILPGNTSAAERIWAGTGMVVGGHNIGGYAATMDNLSLGLKWGSRGTGRVEPELLIPGLRISSELHFLCLRFIKEV
nr:hypothetical protein Itr_chr07CG09380 [Ipomoea trifida]